MKLVLAFNLLFLLPLFESLNHARLMPRGLHSISQSCTIAEDILVISPKALNALSLSFFPKKTNPLIASQHSRRFVRALTAWHSPFLRLVSHFDGVTKYRLNKIAINLFESESPASDYSCEWNFCVRVFSTLLVLSFTFPGFAVD